MVDPYNVYSIRKIRYRADGYITSDDDDIKKDVEEGKVIPYCGIVITWLEE